jgi:lipid A 3-O-deacylase
LNTHLKLALPIYFIYHLALPAQAADLSPLDGLEPTKAPDLRSVFSAYELRLGAYAHDPLSPEKGPVDLNGEVLLAKFNFFPAQTWGALIPRPHFGGTFDFDGKTSNLYTGLTWTFNLDQNVFVEGSFGEAVNNGKIGRYVPPGHNPMGCNWSFHETASVGYRLDEDWSVMTTIEHYSNAGICVENRGLTNYGLRIGRRF